MRAPSAVAAAALAAVLLAGCPNQDHFCDCSPCPLDAGVWIFLSDAATGSTAVADAAAEATPAGTAFTCGGSPFGANVTACHAPFRGSPGAYLVTVGAPGHVPRVVRVDESGAAHPAPSGCCPPCPSTLELHVALAPR